MKSPIDSIKMHTANGFNNLHQFRIENCFEDTENYKCLRGYEINNRDKYCNAPEDSDDDSIYICYLNEEGWSLVQTFPAKVNSMIAQQYNKNGIRLIVIVGIAFGIYAMWLVVYAAITWKRSETKLLNENERYLEMVNVLSENYAEVYCYNKATGEILKQRAKEEVQEAIDKLKETQKDFNEIFDFFIDKYVYENDKEKLRKAVRLENIMEQLEKYASFIVNFRTQVNEEFHHFYLKFARMGEKDDYEHIIVGLANNDKEVREEDKNKTKQKKK